MSTKTSAHGGLYTSRLACSWSLVVFDLYPSNIIGQILYFEDTYLRYLFITSLNFDPDEKTWASKRIALVSIIGSHYLCFLLLFPYVHPSTFSLFLYDLIAVFPEHLPTLTFYDASQMIFEIWCKLKAKIFCVAIRSFHKYYNTHKHLSSNWLRF